MTLELVKEGFVGIIFFQFLNVFVICGNMWIVFFQESWFQNMFSPGETFFSWILKNQEEKIF